MIRRMTLIFGLMYIYDVPAPITDGHHVLGAFSKWV
jgi:hypothetical protein